jgi:uncharacterized protein
VSRDRLRTRAADASDRTAALDALRGAALLGVLLVNLTTEFRVPFLAWLTRFHTHDGALNHGADWLIGVGIEGKSFAIFGMLFGAGIAAQSERALGTPFFLRRFGVLLGIGLIHYVFFFSGDILTTYALLGMALIPFRSLDARALFSASAVAFVAGMFAPSPAVPAHGVDVDLAIRRALSIYRSGTFLAVAEYRLVELHELILPLIVGSLLRTTAMALLGMACWRSGWLRHPERVRARFPRAAAALLVLGGSATAIEAYAASMGKDLGYAGRIATNIGIAGLASTYALGFLFVATAPWSVRWLRPIARLGRMTLTNYLTQSLAFGFVSYGYGLAQYGRWGPAAAIVFGLAFYAAQVAFSDVWLRRYPQGPVEALWRRLTYGAA